MVHLEMMAALLDALPPAHAWCCWATRTSSPRSRPVPCWATCAATPRQAVTAQRPALPQATTGQTLPDALLEPSGPGASPGAAALVMLRKAAAYGPIGALALAVNQGDAPPGPPRSGRRPGRCTCWQQRSGGGGATGPRGRLGAVTACRDYLRAIPARAPRKKPTQPKRRAGPRTGGRARAWGQPAQPCGRIGPARAGCPGAAEWYAGRPVAVTRNDAGLGRSTATSASCCRRRAVACVPTLPTGRNCASVGVAWLAHVETAFAMTVHKKPGARSSGTPSWCCRPRPPGPCSAGSWCTPASPARATFTLVAAQPAVLEQGCCASAHSAAAACLRGCRFDLSVIHSANAAPPTHATGAPQVRAARDA